MIHPIWWENVAEAVKMPDSVAITLYTGQTFEISHEQLRALVEEECIFVPERRDAPVPQEPKP